jgi:hypothetical protein
MTENMRVATKMLAVAMASKPDLQLGTMLQIGQLAALIEIAEILNKDD